MIREKILATIDVGKRGLEIGPLNRPVVTRGMGPVEYIDRATREELQRTYGASDAVEAQDIVEVDHLWGDQSLVECVGGRRVYAYLLASHVIEHVPDLFGWLGEIAGVLIDGGIAAFVVPDKRYTFDMRRRVSSDGELVDAYVRGLRRPDARQIFDCFHNFRNLHPGTEGASPPDGGSTERARELMDLCKRIQVSSEYVDAHCWVLTPRTLADALDLGSRLGLLPFEIADLEPTMAGAHEFFLALRRLPDGLTAEAQRDAFLASRERLALPEEVEAPNDDFEAISVQAQLAIARAAAIESSTSWRVTAPLRAAVGLMRRLRASPAAASNRLQSRRSQSARR